MEKSLVQETLGLLKQIKGDRVLYDLHAHPFEVMCEPFVYKPVRHCDGLFSANASEYQPPVPHEIHLDAYRFNQERTVDVKLHRKLCLLNARRFYTHTGAKVFTDHMELCGIDRVLLLPVMQVDESTGGQLPLMQNMFKGERFMYACCVDNEIPNKEIVNAVAHAVNQYKVKALKIHPSITGINLTHSRGIDRIEHILKASREHKLKVVIHGGMSPDCHHPDVVNYSLARNLEHIDWSLTPETVVIAHGGFYGHSYDDCRENVLPVMSRLFDHYDNLAVDTSGLPFDVLCLLAEYFDLEKIVFGSDALYEKQWMAMVKLWYALRKTAPDAEESFVRIASENPSRLFPSGNAGTRTASTLAMPIFVNGVHHDNPDRDSPLRH